MTRPKQYAKRANIDCSALVREIASRPELWDVKNPSRHNRISLSQKWNEIGDVLNQPAQVCRKKWKYLKDQYRKELRLELRGGQSMWSLYEHLSFIKPYFKALLLAHGEHGEDADNSQNFTFKGGYDPENITVDMDVYSDYLDDVEMANWKYASRLSNGDQGIVDITQEDDNDSAVILSETGKPPVKKIRLVRDESPDHTGSSESEDGSMNFFKSLLPFFDKFNDIQKLRVRNTIQSIILEELKAVGNS